MSANIRIRSYALEWQWHKLVGHEVSQDIPAALLLSSTTTANDYFEMRARTPRTKIINDRLYWGSSQNEGLKAVVIWKPS